MVYKLCLALIAKGKTDGLEEKLDVYYAADKLTTEEYNELLSMLHEGD